MDIMTVAAASISMHQSQLQQASSILMLKKAMSFEETQSAALLEEMQQMPAVLQGDGHLLNTRI